jgi:putative flippase GtrA
MKSAWAEFAVFAAIGLAGLGMSELMMWGLVSGLGVAVLVAKVLVTGVVFIWNFGVRKLLLFRGAQTEASDASGA